MQWSKNRAGGAHVILLRKSHAYRRENLTISCDKKGSVFAIFEKEWWQCGFSCLQIASNYNSDFESFSARQKQKKKGQRKGSNTFWDSRSLIFSLVDIDGTEFI